MTENSTTQNTKFIDIDKVINKKNPKLYKALPRFVIKYIKRILHQDDFNSFMDNQKDKIGLDFVEASLEHWNIHGELIGRENFSEDGRYIFAANHPLGGFDGLLFMWEMGKIFGETKSIINDVLLQLKNLSPLFAGVDSFGNNNRETLVELDKIFKSDQQILIFPAGLVSRRINGVITDLVWKKTFISKAVQYQRDVVPVFIEGRLSNFFYNFANFRKLLHIKANLEMFYLADETYKLKNKVFKLKCGKPISYKTFDHRFHQNQWAELVKKYIYRLKKGETDTFDDFIAKCTL